jgi:hypothetical protein
MDMFLKEKEREGGRREEGRKERRKEGKRGTRHKEKTHRSFVYA